MFVYLRKWIRVFWFKLPFKICAKIFLSKSKITMLLTSRLESSFLCSVFNCFVVGGGNGQTSPAQSDSGNRLEWTGQSELSIQHDGLGRDERQRDRLQKEFRQNRQTGRQTQEPKGTKRWRPSVLLPNGLGRGLGKSERGCQRWSRPIVFVTWSSADHGQLDLPRGRGLHRSLLHNSELSQQRQNESVARRRVRPQQRIKQTAEGSRRHRRSHSDESLQRMSLAV